jgi:hypothetical protein
LRSEIKNRTAGRDFKPHHVFINIRTTSTRDHFFERGEVCLFRDKVAAEARDDALCAEGGYLSGGVPL